METTNPEPLRTWTFSPERRARWILIGRIFYTIRNAEECYDLQLGELVEAIFKPGRYGIALTLEVERISPLNDGNIKVYFSPVEDKVRRPTPPPPKPKRGPVVFIPRAEMRRRPR